MRFKVRLPVLISATSTLLVMRTQPMVGQTMPIGVARAKAASEEKPQVTSKPNDQRVAVFLDGSVKGSDNKKEKSTTNGSLAIATESDNWDANFSINIAAVMDTVRSSFGKSMLVPGNGGFQAGSFEFRRLILPASVPRLYARGYLSASSMVWELSDPSDSAKRVGVGANAIGAGLGFSWQAIGGVITEEVDAKADEDKAKSDSLKAAANNTTPKAKEKTVKTTALGARLDFAVIRRALHGDIMDDAYTAQRESMFSTQQVFYGYELGFQLQYGTLRGAINFYSFPNAKTVQGFTRGQVTAGFAIAAPIASTTFHH